jgi:hypothetical protein
MAIWVLYDLYPDIIHLSIILYVFLSFTLYLCRFLYMYLVEILERSSYQNTIGTIVLT